MCHRVQCHRCEKPTWAGCGRHVEQALAGVPADQRCSCPPPERPSFKFPVTETSAPTAAPERKGLLTRIFGRK
jgi:hypothetical protein